MGKKYGIVGSRRRNCKSEVLKFINRLNPDDIVISGGATGVDTWAAMYAAERGLEAIIFEPDISKCRKSYEFTKAYYARNFKIAEACDILIAFVSPDRKGGTENTIKQAAKLNKEIIIL
jgi:predicted Rossmann fold nucleotide-binding protein DprA/Smf involved in DNA uptake